MDIDGPPSTHPHDQQRPPYTLHPTNALAGPSTPPAFPSLFLPPPAPPRPSPHFKSTDDLLSRFQLLSAYDRYVRPYTFPSGASSASVDKGKGKEKDIQPKDPSTPSGLPVSTASNQAEEEDGAAKGEKKWKNNYRHLIKGVPGKHSMKKDDHLMTMMQVPPKQRNNITPFDLRTQREAFSVSLEGLKGWNINVLVAESPQAREDRKRRKEMKRLAKVQQLAATSGAAPAASATPVPTAVGTPGASGHPPVVRPNTPRPGSAPTSRPGNPPPAQNTAQPRGSTPAGVGTPRSVSMPGAASTTAATSNAPPPPISAATSAPAQLNRPASTTVHAPTPAPAPASTVTQDPRRGVKREREREDSVSTGVRPVNGNTQAAEVPPVANGGAKPYMVVGAKAGMNGIRPRPVKKQRVDGGPVPVQQPTPHA